MKRPSAASQKRVNAENLAGLGAERLAELLLAVANSRLELKRQLRMELAANQGVEHLAAEVDKRLTSLETLSSKVSWRQRPTFLRDLDALRLLIAERMAGLDGSAALERMWRFMNTARRISGRVKDKHGDSTYCSRAPLRISAHSSALREAWVALARWWTLFHKIPAPGRTGSNLF